MLGREANTPHWQYSPLSCHILYSKAYLFIQITPVGCRIYVNLKKVYMSTLISKFPGEGKSVIWQVKWVTYIWMWVSNACHTWWKLIKISFLFDRFSSSEHAKTFTSQRMEFEMNGFARFSTSKFHLSLNPNEFFIHAPGFAKLAMLTKTYCNLHFCLTDPHLHWKGIPLLDVEHAKPLHTYLVCRNR